ncbi:MAG: DUF420 domain-containing protein [Bacteroidota bacterium]
MTAANIALEKKLNIAAWVATGAVLLLIGLMRRIKIPLPDGMSFTWLPPVYSIMNALTAVLLIYALYQIKQKNVEKHRKAIYAALTCSALFLLGYVLYHFTTPETIYGDINDDGIVDAAELAAVGSMRTVYLVFLFTHIVLAGLILPFILLTFIRSYTGQIERHRKMAKWVFPIWLYVAITGPVVYFLLYPYY